MAPSCRADDTHDSALSNLEKWFCTMPLRAPLSSRGKVGFSSLVSPWIVFGVGEGGIYRI